MQGQGPMKRSHLLLLLLLNFIFPASRSLGSTQEDTYYYYYCGNSRIGPPLLLENSAAAFSPPLPNSLLLFNCITQENHYPSLIRNCTQLGGCGRLFSSIFRETEMAAAAKWPPSCLVVEDMGKLEAAGFDPKQWNCTHYSRMHRKYTSNLKGFELGTRISFDVPDHVPNPCDECKKPRGNCGVGLRCICHPQECKDKVISAGSFLKPYGTIMILGMLWSFILNRIAIDLH